MDYIAVSGLVIAILGGLGTFINTLHITECEFCCIKSDCIEKSRTKYQSRRSSPAETPTEETPMKLPTLKSQPISII
jgi:hypothetical protein